MSHPQITGYSPRDQQGVTALVTEVLREFGDAVDPVLDADLAAPEQHYRRIWLLKAAGTVVGSAAITPAEGGITTVKRMYLRPEQRGRGWGRRLLETALEGARQEGCHTVLLDTADRQHVARRLYERAGFLLMAEDSGVRYYAKTVALRG